MPEPTLPFASSSARSMSYGRGNVDCCNLTGERVDQLADGNGLA